MAQEPPRIEDPNSVLWITPQATFKLGSKFDLYTEYQFRRDQWGAEPMQHLLRTGLQYNLSQEISVLIGYAEIETYPYGDPAYPLALGGRAFSEHRLYEQLIQKTALKHLELQHRFRLEQRYIEKQRSDGSNDGWKYVNRARYQVRMNIPLKGNTIEEREPYLSIADELFIGFGKKVKLNIFDQNRFYGMAGYKFGPHFKVEGGFFSQILQLGGPVNKMTPDNKIETYTVFQYNTGLFMACLFNVDLRKRFR